MKRTRGSGLSFCVVIEDARAEGWPPGRSVPWMAAWNGAVTGASLTVELDWAHVVLPDN